MGGHNFGVVFKGAPFYNLTAQCAMILVIFGFRAVHKYGTRWLFAPPLAECHCRHATL